MTKIIKVSVIIISVLSFYFSNADHAIGQQVTTPVQIATEKVNISGEIFFMHKVVKKQTLYSISKAYNVPIDSILKHNPSTKDGLKAGSIIYIPSVVEKLATSVSQSKKEIREKKSKRSKKYKRHTVKWYETMEDIADYYGVSVRAIIHLNSLEANVVLKKRQKIYIPDRKYEIPSAAPKKIVPIEMPEKEKTTQETITYYTYSYIEDGGTRVSRDTVKIDNSLYSHDQRTYKISLILPFNASLSADKASTDQMEFYSGVLMAIKDLESKLSPFEYKLNVVDLSSYSSVWEMLSSGIIDGSELIIGPIVQKDLEAVARFAKNNRIPIVSPMDVRTEILLLNNPYLFLFPSLPKLSMDNLVEDFIKTDPLDSTKATIIFEKGTDLLSSVTSVTENFKKHSIDYDALSYGILEGRGIDTIMYYVLDSIHHNKVYIASESEAFVSDVLRNLYLLQIVDTFSIGVYGSSKWRKFETLEPEYLHALNARFSLQYNVDYSDSLTTSFVKRYWEVFNAEPSPLSFQGYDITTFFLSYLNEFGRAFPAYLPKERKKLLQYDVLFEPAAIGSGFKNEATRNIIYLEDWEIGNW